MTCSLTQQYLLGYFSENWMVFFSDSYVCSSLFLMMTDPQNMSTTFKIPILFLTLLIFYLIFFLFCNNYGKDIPVYVSG